MGLFEKKFCDICGEKISLLGNRKLENGNMCSHCAKLISPFMTDRKQTSVTEMKEHLAYRENNKRTLASFTVTESYGDGKKVYIDRTKNSFIVSYNSPGSWENENPDVIPLSQILACNLDVKENRTEEYAQDREGNRISYNPPRYTYDYDFYLHINVSNQWFDEIEIKLNNSDVEGMNSQRYHNYQILAQQITGALTGTPVNISQGTGFDVGSMFTPGGLANTFVNQVAQNAAQQYPQGQPAPQYYQGQPAPQYNPNQPPMNVSYNNANYGQTPPGAYQPAPGQNNYAQPGVPQQYPQQSADWFCPNCGKRNAGKFCPDCGTPKP